jgi:hypothetical protein
MARCAIVAPVGRANVPGLPMIWACEVWSIVVSVSSVVSSLRAPEPRGNLTGDAVGVRLRLLRAHQDPRTRLIALLPAGEQVLDLLRCKACGTPARPQPQSRTGQAVRRVAGVAVNGAAAPASSDEGRGLATTEPVCDETDPPTRCDTLRPCHDLASQGLSLSDRLRTGSRLSWYRHECCEGRVACCG